MREFPLLAVALGTKFPARRKVSSNESRTFDSFENVQQCCFLERRNVSGEFPLPLGLSTQRSGLYTGIENEVNRMD
jgi:hypothetical protein